VGITKCHSGTDGFQLNFITEQARGPKRNKNRTDREKKSHVALHHFTSIEEHQKKRREVTKAHIIAIDTLNEHNNENSRPTVVYV